MSIPWHSGTRFYRSPARTWAVIHHRDGHTFSMWRPGQPAYDLPVIADQTDYGTDPIILDVVLRGKGYDFRLRIGPDFCMSRGFNGRKAIHEALTLEDIDLDRLMQDDQRQVPIGVLGALDTRPSELLYLSGWIHNPQGYASHLYRLRAHQDGHWTVVDEWTARTMAGSNVTYIKGKEVQPLPHPLEPNLRWGGHEYVLDSLESFKIEHDPINGRLTDFRSNI